MYKIQGSKKREKRANWLASDGNAKDGGGGGILPEPPKKFSVAMVKLKSFRVNQRILEKPFCQCQWAI
jgi:hypothetical protein